MPPARTAPWSTWPWPGHPLSGGLSVCPVWPRGIPWSTLSNESVNRARSRSSTTTLIMLPVVGAGRQVATRLPVRVSRDARCAAVASDEAEQPFVVGFHPGGQRTTGTGH